MTTLLTDNAGARPETANGWKFFDRASQSTATTRLEPSGAASYAVKGTALLPAVKETAALNSNVTKSYVVVKAQARDAVPLIPEPAPRTESVVKDWAEGVVVLSENGIATCSITSLDREYRVSLPIALFPLEPSVGQTFRLNMASDDSGFRTPRIELTSLRQSDRLRRLHAEIDQLMAEF